MAESGERIVIKPEVERRERFGGWLMLGVVSLFLGLCAWLSTLPNVRIKSDDVPILIFIGAMMLLLLVPVSTMAMRMAFETQIWIAGPNYFERRSELLGLRWSKTYHATAWRIEQTKRIDFTLSPVGARVIPEVLPFYSTSSASKALKLGRQLAEITDWPLRISAELSRLEKELEI